MGPEALRDGEPYFYLPTSEPDFGILPPRVKVGTILLPSPRKLTPSAKIYQDFTVTRATPSLVNQK